MSDLIERQAVEAITWEEPSYTDALNALTEVREKIRALPSVSTKKLDKAKSEIRYGENKAYNADFTMGCEYAISVIERMFEEVGE